MSPTTHPDRPVPGHIERDLTPSVAEILRALAAEQRMWELRLAEMVAEGRFHGAVRK